MPGTIETTIAQTLDETTAVALWNDITTKIADIAATYELPALTGSDKQIAWGTDIRHEIISHVQTARANLVTMGTRPAAAALVADWILTRVQAEVGTDASNWIDRRKMLPNWIKQAAAALTAAAEKQAD